MSIKNCITFCLFYFIVTICCAQKPPQNGPYKTYYKSGELKSSGNYKNGKRVGVWKDFYKTGELEWEYNYIKGKKKFARKSFFKNGNLKTESVMFKGEKHYKSYYETGELFCDNSTDAGYANDFFKNGNLKVERPYVDGELSGVWRKFYETGEKEWEVDYKESLVHGDYSQFYKSGILKLHGQNKKGKKEGVEVYYGENGSTIQEGKYVNGKLHGNWVLYGEDKKVEEKLKFSKGELKSSFNRSVEEIEIPTGLLYEEPIFPGCEKLWGLKKRKKCLTENVSEHFKKEFDKRVAINNGIFNRMKIKSFFRINSEGNVTKITIRGPLKVVEKEALRVLRLLPKMEPGKLRGKNIETPYSLPIIYAILK